MDHTKKFNTLFREDALDMLHSIVDTINKYGLNLEVNFNIVFKNLVKNFSTEKCYIAFGMVIHMCQHYKARRLSVKTCVNHVVVMTQNYVTQLKNSENRFKKLDDIVRYHRPDNYTVSYV
jgi:hypothetical protein